MKTLTQIIGLLVLLTLASAPASATTYKYKDASGNTVYSQNPPDNPDTPYEVMGEVQSHARPGSNSQAYSAPAQDANDSGSDQVINQQVEDAENLRQQNCEAAKKNLEIYTAFRRVRNEEGEVVRLDDEVRQQKIDQAKQNIKEFCD